MSYELLLLRVPPGASEEDVERIARSTTEAEDGRAPGPRDAEIERRKRALVDALVAECSELEGAEPDYEALARAENISEEQARDRFRWWTVSTPDEGAGIEITIYDDYISVDMPSAAGTDEDWEDVWQYLEILVREGGFVVWDPQGTDLVDLAAGPFGGGKRKKRPQATKRRRKRRRDEGDDDEDRDVEPEDIRRGGEIAVLINRITDEAIADPLAAAGFKRSGRVRGAVCSTTDSFTWSTCIGVRGIAGWKACFRWVPVSTLASSPKALRCTSRPVHPKSTTAR